MPQVPGLPIDRLREALAQTYVIDRELGRGGMSAVFLAQDCKHDRAVANAGNEDLSAYYAARAMAVDPEDPMVLYNVACAFGILDKKRECVDALEKAVNQGWGDKNWVEHDSDLDSVRNEPRFQTLLQAM